MGHGTFVALFIQQSKTVTCEVAIAIDKWSFNGEQLFSTD